MTRRKNVLLDYLRGVLTIEELRAHIANNRDSTSAESLHLAELDRRCRQILPEMEPPPGAPERLKELVSLPRVDDALSKTFQPGAFWRIGGRPLAFDVLGAQYTPKKRPSQKPLSRAKKKGTGKGRDRSSKNNN